MNRTIMDYTFLKEMAELENFWMRLNDYSMEAVPYLRGK